MKSKVSIVAVMIAALVAISCGPAQKGAGYPSEPDKAILYVVSELQNENPGVLWEALPESYRADVSEIVHGFAAKLDPDVYNKAFDLAAKLVDILKTKKEFILASSTFEKAPADKEKAAANWDAVVGMLETFVTSDVSDLEKMKTIDIGAWIEGTGSTLMAQAGDVSKISEEDPYNKEFQAKLSQIQVEVISSEADAAVLKISVPDEEPEEISMVRVEDRWVPKEMAEEWDEKMAEARQQLEELDAEKMAQTKMQAMMMMGMAEAFLDQIAAVDSAEAFDEVLKGLLGGFMGGPMEDMEE